MLRLVGPPGLDKLDRLTLTVLDDKVRGASQLAGGPDAEAVKRQVWGPYRFRPGVDGADQNGRTASLTPQYLPLARRTDQRFQLEAIDQPPWDGSPTSNWADLYRDRPLRLALHCERDDDDPWEVEREVSPAGSAGSMS